MTKEKDYYIENIESAEELMNDINQKIRLNVIFIVTGVMLAGVGFGLGEEIFNNSTLETITSYGGIGMTCGSIQTLRENLKIKSSLKEMVKTKGTK